MKLGFYYHIPLCKTDNELMVPSYLGVFLDELAKQVDSLTLFFHEAGDSERHQCDKEVQGKNIVWINLGYKMPAWHRILFNRISLKRFEHYFNQCDCILVRSPTPLAPFFSKYLRDTSLFFFIVGDYEAGAENMKVTSIRELLIKYFLLFSNKLFIKQIHRTDVFVNSPALFLKYKAFARSIFLVKTSTITENDFYLREDTCRESEIRILFTGSINPLKGLLELIEATSLLVNDSYDIKIVIAGKEASKEKKFEKELIRRSRELNIHDRISFIGFKTVGEQLNEVYRNADIYAIPSYHEGFPRTIWEAMANGLPVVASNVGAIPYYLSNEESVMLVEPRDSKGLYLAIKEIIENNDLRRRLISKGHCLAREALQEKQIELLVSRISHLTLSHNLQKK